MEGLMRFWRIAVAVSIITALSCMQHSNPFDINDPNYDPPEVYIDSSSVNSGDSTALESITLKVSVNKPDVEIRWRLDSLAWSPWQEQGTVTVSGYGTGRHTITVAGWYGEGGEIVDTAISFVKVTTPNLTVDTTSLLDDSLVAIDAGALCTLRVNAGGSGNLTFYWHRSGEIIDSTSGNKLTIGPFASRDSGSYFVVVRNNWGTDTSDMVFLRYIPPVNNPPVAVRDSFAVAEDGTLTVSLVQSILKNDTDKDGDTLSAVMVDSTRNGALTLSANGTFVYRPTSNFFGADSFTYKVRDTKNALSPAVAVRITVTPVNDAPIIAKNDRITLNEGQKATVAATKIQVTDVDNAAASLTYTVRRIPAHGTLLAADTSLDSGNTLTQKTIDDGLLAYQHDGGETTKDTAIFSVSDGSGGRLDTVRIMFDIAPVNDVPYFATKLDLAVVEGGSKTVSSATLQVKDNDNTPAQLVFTIVNDVSHGQVRKSGTALDAGATFTQQDIDSGRIVYQHDKSNTTRDSLSFTVSDGKGGTITQTWLIIRVGAVDDPPIAIDQGVSTNEDTPLGITLTATDPEGVAITGWEISRQPKHGTLTGSGAMRTYTPEQDFFGADTFLFRANDGVNWSDTGIIAIAVLPINDAPVWKQSTVELSIKEGKTVSLDLNTVFDKDPEGNAVTFTKKTGVGTLTGRTWSWTPGYTAAAASPASCVITATDNGSPVKSADITLTITVSDSLCRLTTTVTIGNGTISAPGTMFDPGTVVRVTANPGTDYVFKNWTGDVPSANQNAASVSITMNGDKSVAATFVKTIETVTLNVGESYVHGTIYVNGYYYLTTRTYPAKVLKVNANNLSDYMEATFPSDYNEAEQIVYSNVTGKLYTVFSHWSKVIIAEIDPVTLAFDEDKIVDTTHHTSGGLGHTMATDGSYLYATAYLSGGITQVCKYSLTTFSGTPVATLQMDSSCVNGHAMQVLDGILYMTGANNPPWVAKVRTSDLAVVQTNHLRGGVYATDDFALTDRYMFLSTESSGDAFAGTVYRVDAQNLNNVFEINTGVTGGSCFAVANALQYVWVVFATSPGTLVRIDPTSSEFKKYRLDYDMPNEIINDGKRILITYWGQNPGRIQAFDPQYLNGREIP